MVQMSREYAQALFMLAKENDATDEYGKALSVIKELIEENPSYLDFLSSPAIELSERIEMLSKAFSPIAPEHVISFMSLLCERGRIREFYDCEREYKALLEFSKNVSAAKVKTVVPLTDDEKTKLAEKLVKICGREVMLECETDSGLIGGIIVELDGKILDMSVKTRLHEVKDVIIK